MKDIFMKLNMLWILTLFLSSSNSQHILRTIHLLNCKILISLIHSNVFLPIWAPSSEIKIKRLLVCIEFCRFYLIQCWMTVSSGYKNSPIFWLETFPKRSWCIRYSYVWFEYWHKNRFISGKQQCCNTYRNGIQVIALWKMNDQKTDK